MKCRKLKDRRDIVWTKRQFRLFEMADSFEQRDKEDHKGLFISYPLWIEVHHWVGRVHCGVPCAGWEAGEQVLGQALQIMLVSYQDYMYERDKGTSLCQPHAQARVGLVMGDSSSGCG